MLKSYDINSVLRCFLTGWILCSIINFIFLGTDGIWISGERTANPARKSTEKLQHIFRRHNGHSEANSWKNNEWNPLGAFKEEKIMVRFRLSEQLLFSVSITLKEKEVIHWLLYYAVCACLYCISCFVIYAFSLKISPLLRISSLA